MQELIEKVFSLVILLTGLSAALHARFWVKLATDMVNKPETAFAVMCLVLPLGLVVVIGHNVWVADWPVAITVFGWIVTIKSSLFLLLPQSVTSFTGWPETSMRRLTTINGVAMAVIGAVLTYQFFSQ